MFIKVFKRLLPILLFGSFLLFILWPFYREGKIISGGEGSYFLDFPLLQKNWGYSWVDYGAGIYNISTNLGHVFHLSFLQGLVSSQRVVNFVMIFLLYCLPFLAVYLLGLELKLKPEVSFLVALFYLVNPFMSNFLKSINQWNMLAAYILPAFFWLILRFYNRNFKLFLFFGLHSLLSAFTNANPPTMVLYQIAIILFVFLISVFKEKKVSFAPIVKNYLIVFFSFILFNFWWLVNWFYIYSDVQKSFTGESALSWLRGSGEFVPALWRAINLTSLLEYPQTPSYDYFNLHFSRFLAFVILAIPILIVIYYLFKKNFGRLHHLIIGLTLILFGFLSKGIAGFFGSVYGFLVTNFSGFRIFRTASEKWGLMFTFFLTLFLIFILKELRKDRYYRLILVLFVFYIVIASGPFVTSNFIPDYKFDQKVTGSRKFLDKIEYQNLRQDLNNDPRLYKTLSLPGSLNYQVALRIEGKKFYTGNDPVLNNTNKPFFAPYNGNYSQRFDLLFGSISEPNYLQLLGFFNIQKLIINKDMYPWFGLREKESIPEIETILDESLSSEKNKVIDLYDTGDFYLPRFYVPQQVFYSSPSNQDALLTITGLEDFSKRTAVYLKPKRISEEFVEVESELAKKVASEIVLVGQIQSAIDEAKLRSGAMGFDPMGVLFPYARWKPGGLVYRFVRRKEEKAKSQFSDPKILFEQHLFFAAKRIYEIEKWEPKLKEEQYFKVLEDYQEEMSAAFEKLDRLASENIDTFPLLVQFEVSFGAHKDRLLNILKGNYQGEESERIRIAKMALEDIDHQFKELIEKHYSKTKYFFKIPEEGEYQILIESRKIPLDLGREGLVQEGNGEMIKPNFENLDDERLFSFGKKRFNQGDQLLTFINNVSDNLLTDEWKRGERVEIEKEIKMFGKGDMVYQEIKEWQPKTAYKISMKYKTEGGEMRIFLTEEKGDNGGLAPAQLDELLDSKGEWEEFKTVVKADRKIQSAKLYLSNITDLGQANVECREVKVEAIYEPEIILRKSKNNYFSKLPQITFRRINPTKYLVEVKRATDPYFLVFSESFHRGWKAYLDKREQVNSEQEIVAVYFDGEIKEGPHKNTFFDKDIFVTWGKKPLSEEKHTLINGYANSWYLTPDDVEGKENYQLIIEYWPQKLFNFGVLMTVLTVLISLIIGAWKLVILLRSRFK